MGWSRLVNVQHPICVVRPLGALFVVGLIWGGRCRGACVGRSGGGSVCTRTPGGGRLLGRLGRVPSAASDAAANTTPEGGGKVYRAGHHRQYWSDMSA